MVPVAGVPLVARALENFLAARIRDVAIILNEEEGECARFLRSRFGGKMALDILVKTTPSSLVSFRELLARRGPGPTLVSTVDAICAPADFAAFVRAAGRLPADSIVLGVTRFVDDEKPLRVTFGKEGRIARVGGEEGDAVTAGLYVVPQRVGRLAAGREFDRLRDFLSWLSESGEEIRGVEVGTVIDVDRAEDLAAADSLAASWGPRKDGE
jgi:NDP-sugar pyrophosphorylase family protein